MEGFECSWFEKITRNINEDRECFSYKEIYEDSGLHSPLHLAQPCFHTLQDLHACTQLMCAGAGAEEWRGTNM